MVKITIIGAGSIVFSVRLISDLVMTPGLHQSKVVLMDIDKHRLNAVYCLATRYAKEKGVKLEFEKTTSREQALKGADFVINTAFVGGYKQMEIERKVAENYGYYRGIGDQVSDYYGGIGAYRQLKFFLDLAQEMERLCPKAWLLHSANPVFEGTTLIGRKSDVKVVGFCHGYAHVEEIIRALGLSPEYVEFQLAGFNHCIWLTRFQYKGQNAYPLLDKWLEEEAPKWWNDERYLFEPRNYQLSPGAFAMYKLFGLFPIGDTVRCVSPWWFNTDLKTKQQWFPAGGMDSEIGWTCRLSRNMEHLKQLLEAAKDMSSTVGHLFSHTPSGEQHIPFINAVVNNEPTRLFLNVPNKGAIKTFPQDVFVEIPVVVSGEKIEYEPIEPFPNRLMLYIMIPRWLRMERTLQAFVDGDRGSLILSLMEDPRTNSFQQAQQLVEELLQQPWNAEALAHYKKTIPDLLR